MIERSIIIGYNKVNESDEATILKIERKFWKGGSNMNCTVTIDWRFVVALGVIPASIILANKIDSEAAERVLIQAINTCRSGMLAIEGKC